MPRRCEWSITLLTRARHFSPPLLMQRPSLCVTTKPLTSVCGTATEGRSLELRGHGEAQGSQTYTLNVLGRLGLARVVANHAWKRSLASIRRTAMGGPL